MHRFMHDKLDKVSFDKQDWGGIAAWVSAGGLLEKGIRNFFVRLCKLLPD